MAKIYDHVDSAIMKGVNEGVRAWNWTTGRTKSDLANICLVGTSAFTSVGLINMSKPLGYAMVPIVLLATAAKSYLNKKSELRELSALEKGLKDPVVEGQKELEKEFGRNAIIINSLLSSCGGASTNYVAEIATGGMLSAVQSYVMRAENFPKRKNVLSRIADDFSNTVAQYKLQRRPVPVRNDL